jgi:hypothetical protein
MDLFPVFAPYLLLLLCPIAMFFSMRLMMKGMQGHQRGMNMAQPHSNLSDDGAVVGPIDAQGKRA